MKKTFKKILIAIVVVFSLVGVGASASAASKYINWGGTENYKLVKANIDKLGKRSSQLKQENKELEKSFATIVEDLQKETRTLKETETKLVDKETELKELHTKKVGLEKDLEKLNDEKIKNKEEIKHLKEKIESKEKDIKLLKNEIKTQKKELSAQETQIDNLKSEKSQLKEKLEKSETDIAEKDKKLEQAEIDMKDLREESEKLLKQLEKESEESHFPKWESGNKSYKYGDIVTHNGNLWRVKHGGDGLGEPGTYAGDGNWEKLN